MYCPSCKIEQEGKFCRDCGKELNEEKSEVNAVFDEVIDHFKEFRDTRGHNALRIKDLFTSVFEKHTKQDSELLLISGTSYTTPPESEISSSWPKPWLYSRVFAMLALSYIFLYICTMTFYNDNTIPGLIFMGSVTMPFTLVIFFWEANAPRNISLFDVIEMFFVGGVASLLVTIFLFEFVSLGSEMTFFSAVIIGIVEELGKLIIVAYFIKKMKSKYILNGLLIGAVIGAGFATFESAGYAMRFALSGGGLEGMVDVIYLRGMLAGGGHIVWAAISGAAICLVNKNKSFDYNVLVSKDFLKLFAVPVVLHSIWDMPINLFNEIYLVPIILTIIAWVFILVLINAGLKQITELSYK